MNTGADIHLYIGIVTAPTPYLNSYLVDIKGVGRVIAVAGGEGSGDRRGSTGGGAAYLPGAQVLVAAPEPTSDKALGQTAPCVIISAFAMFPKIEVTEFVPRAGTSNPSDYNQNQVADILIDSNFEKILRQDRSFDTLVDTLPGDWTKVNATGSLLRLSLFLAQIGAGPDCMLSFHGMDKTAHLSFDNLIQDSVTFSQNLSANSEAPMSSRMFAFSVKEGLGAITEGAEVFEEDTENGTYSPVADDQYGYFRQILLEGGGPEGSYNFTQVDQSGEDINTYSNMQLAGLTSVQQRMDGIYRIKAAKEIGLQRTGCIPVPIPTKEQMEPLSEEEIAAIEALRDNPGDPYEGMTDDEAKIEAFGLSDEEEYYASQNFMYEEFETFEEQALFFKNLQLEGRWQMPPADAEGTKIAPTGDTQLPKLEPNAPAYNLEQLQSLIQEAIELMPGRRIKLWKNSSAFLMFEDGGMLLEDGMGSSIKFERGNLVLSAAGDIKFLPGRDIITMAPGKTIMKSKGRIDLSSTDESVTLKAEENMELLAGNGGSGAMTLEGRGTTSMNNANETQLERGQAVGGGVYVKSESGINLMSRDMYIGADASGEDNAQGLNRTSNPCNIIMDSGSGMLHLAGSNGSFLFDNNLEVGHRQSAAGMYIRGSSMFHVSNVLSIVSTVLNIRQGDGNISRPTVTPGGVNARTQYPLPAGSPQVLVQGDLRASGQIGAVGAISTEARLQANLGADYQPRPRARYLNINMPQDNPSAVRSALREYSTNLSRLLENHIRQGLMTEKAHTYAEFSYPDSEAYGINTSQTYFKEAKWQRLLNSPGEWSENIVEHSILQQTYPYPGKKVYEEDSRIILAKAEDGGVEKRAFSEYKTNT
jgi:hypothetical protein